MASLGKLIDAKMKADGLNLTKAAKKAGVSLPSFRASLVGKSAPNARSIGKYASFLGISADAVMAASGRSAEDAKGKPGRKAKGKPGRKAKVAKVKGPKGKPGRKPNPGIGKAKAKKLANLIAGVQARLNKLNVLAAKLA
jgi:hypothetical protein